MNVKDIIIENNIIRLGVTADKAKFIAKLYGLDIVNDFYQLAKIIKGGA